MTGARFKEQGARLKHAALWITGDPDRIVVCVIAAIAALAVVLRWIK